MAIKSFFPSFAANFLEAIKFRRLFKRRFQKPIDTSIRKTCFLAAVVWGWWCAPWKPRNEKVFQRTKSPTTHTFINTFAFTFGKIDKPIHWSNLALIDFSNKSLCWCVLFSCLCAFLQSSASPDVICYRRCPAPYSKVCVSVCSNIHKSTHAHTQHSVTLATVIRRTWDGGASNVRRG